MEKMKTLFAITILLSAATALFADDDPYIIKQKLFVTAIPTYQAWNQEGNNISQVSFPLYAYLPLSRSLGVTLRNSPASTTGDNLTDLQGFTDTQIGVSYHLEPANLVFHLGVNVPSGQRELSEEEFNTSIALSYKFYDFRVPNFGKGLNVNPGISWAFPLSEQFVLGLGASYLYNGKYKPIKDMPDDYDPGDEIQFAGGFDIAANPTTTVTADVIYTLYEADRLGDKKVYEAGDKLAANAQFRKFFAFNELLLMAYYRNRGKSDVPVNGVSQPGDKTITPAQFGFLGQYRIRIHPKFYLGLIAEARNYQKTDILPGVSLFGGGLAPEISLSPAFKIISRFKFLSGKFEGGDSISNLEAGVGIHAGL